MMILLRNCKIFTPSSINFQRQWKSFIGGGCSCLMKKHSNIPTVNLLGRQFVQIRKTWAKTAVESSPPFFRPYLRLMRADKPIGTWLLYWPCTWSICLTAAPGMLPDFYLLSLFGVGAFLMRGSGCVINDLWDKDYDKKVERTKDRPLASGELSSYQGLIFLSGLLSVSLTILLQLNWYSVFLGAASLIPVSTYPLFKRITYWPQLVLGLTINWGALLGWSAVVGHVEWAAALPLYAACLSWTMIYDTIYAHQDKIDDSLIGVKSTALKFGDKTKLWMTFFGSSMILNLAACGYVCDQSWPYFIGLGITAGHIGWQISSVNVNNSNDCWKKFSSNKYLGFIMFLSILIANCIKK